MTPQEFRKLLEPHARKVQAKYGIPWQVMLAQVALETGWLKHPTVDRLTGLDSFNLFNIKGHASNGSVEILTSEYVNSKKVNVVAKFRAYLTYEESFEDYAKLLTSNKRYAPCMQSDSPQEFARRLQDCGYATDPAYSDKLISIMNKYFKE